MTARSYGHQLSYCVLRCLNTYTGVPFTTVRRFTAKPLKPRKEKASGFSVHLLFVFFMALDQMSKRFVDQCKVRVQGGQGGNGLVSFLRASHAEFGGPDGGNGGNGGHVIFSSSKIVNSLSHLKPIFKALDGVSGRSTNRDGKNAEHLYVEVPIGTTILDKDGKTLTALEEERDYYIAARGGAGGKGNSHFATSAETTPRFAEQGGEGEERILYLEMKTMAHAGLIGFPNAGKSTLLQAISRARPKIAPYPFTTLHPYVGIVQYDDHVQLSVADIPGLVPDAHRNKGLGISFLRHIERCICLLYVIDLSVDEPWDQLKTLKYELDQYSPGLSERPNVIIGNKMDLEVARSNFIHFQKKTDLPIIPVSAMNRQNLQQLLSHLRKLYDLNNLDSD